MKRRIIALITILVLLITLSLNVFASNTSNVNDENNNEENTEKNETKELTEEEIKNIQELDQKRREYYEKINENNKKLEYVEDELSAALVEIQKLDDEIQKYSNELDKCNDSIDKLQKSIDSAENKLNVLENDYEKRSQALSNRLVEVYKAGDITFLDVLLSSKSLTEFVSSYYFIKELTEYDNESLEHVEDEKNTIQEIKEKLEKEKLEIIEIKAKKEQANLMLKNTKIIQEEKASKLTEAEKKIQDSLIKYKREINKIENTITNITGGPTIDIQYTGGNMIWPVAKSGTAITSYYGGRTHPISGIASYHSGIDIGNAYYGTPVVAALDGVVTYAGELGGYGNCVIINHGNGLSTVYGHGQVVLTTLNKKVKQGELIMEVGSTGNSTGPHLHFEVRIDGYTVDPLLYVNEPL